MPAIEPPQWRAVNAQNKAKQPDVLPAKEAKSKVGETITVEAKAKVAEVNKTEKIIRINLDARFPKQELTEKAHRQLV